MCVVLISLSCYYDVTIIFILKQIVFQFTLRKSFYLCILSDITYYDFVSSSSRSSVYTEHSRNVYADKNIQGQAQGLAAFLIRR